MARTSQLVINYPRDMQQSELFVTLGEQNFVCIFVSYMDGHRCDESL